jgi:hypothetical protein
MKNDLLENLDMLKQYTYPEPFQFAAFVLKLI